MKSRPAPPQNRFSTGFILVICALLCALGFAIGYGVRSRVSAGLPFELAEENPNLYPYLARRLFIENPSDVLINFTSLRHYVEDYVNKANTQQEGPPSLGIYFEYLPSGVSIGINENSLFVSASLMKIPLVMAVFKEVEAGRIDVTEILTVSEETIDLRSGVLGGRGVGAQVTIEEAIRLTVIESDNTAAKLLFARLPQGKLERVFDALDIPYRSDTQFIRLSPENYSSILRSLYFSSYLEKKESDQILSDMTQSNFPYGIRGGVPAEVPIAHKFGLQFPDTDPTKSRTDLPGNEIITAFTNCGIIYLPKRPYLLCAMARGISKDEAEKHIHHVSQAIYRYVSSTNVNAVD